MLYAVGFGSAVGLAPQASATPPFGIYHDLRWLLVYHDSWWLFGAEVVAALVLRSAFISAVMWVAWPRDCPRPRARSMVRRNLVFVALTMVVLSPWAAVSVAASVTSLSWFVLGEFLPIFFLAMVLQRGGLTAGWWRGMPSPAAAGWSLASLAVITLGAMAVGAVPGAWAIPVAGLAGVVNGLLWRQVVGYTVRARPTLVRVPVTPIAILATVLALVLMSQLSAVGSAVASRPPPRINASAADRHRQVIVYVAGYNSTYRPGRGDRSVGRVRFSYSGIGPRGNPLPYGSVDTHRSLESSARLLAIQIARIHARTHQPVALVSQSEGTLVVRAFLARYPARGVTSAVLLSPLVRPGRAYYPPADARSGWGIAVGWELRGILGIVRAVSGTDIFADEPFLRSVLDDAPLYRNRMLCPVRGVRILAFLPVAGAVVVPSGPVSAVPAVELPGLHAGLLGRADVQRRIRRFLAGHEVAGRSTPSYRLVQLAGGAWQAPALALRLNPVWRPRAERRAVRGAGTDSSRLC